MNKLDTILCINPLQKPDPFFLYALRAAKALGVLELGLDEESARRALMQLETMGVTRYGVRIAEGTPFDPQPMLRQASLVVISTLDHLASCAGKRVLVQVTSLKEAKAAADAGVFGLIAKGSESGGRVGEKSAFILFQQLCAAIHLPVLVQGGIGERTASAVIAAGAAGVVLDSQLALCPESCLNLSIKRAIAAMDGGQTRVLGGHRLFNRADLPIFKCDEECDQSQIIARLGGDDLSAQYLPLGQDAALAKGLIHAHGNAKGIIRAIHAAIADHAAYALSHPTLGPGSPFAVAHRIERPVAMGPMARISDNPAFAERIARGGALPFMGLSVLSGERVKELAAQGRALLGHRPWGVGLLGFIPPELFAEQIAALKDDRPHAAILAGGNAAQAQKLEEMGIAAFLHAPSAQLLDMFLKEGIRKFVFEGSECGGHLGPLSSFCLWEMAIDRLVKQDKLEELHILFAGGIHDARSAAMAATLSAPLARRGAKIGVLMGTAYLFTNEAIETKALMPAYQKKALACEATIELVSGPGQVTRCIESAYTGFFVREKAAMKLRGLDARSIHLELEKLNLGRLRIATRGQAHGDNGIAAVDEKIQLEEGMYSVGQLAALRNAVVSIDQLHGEVSEGAQRYLNEVRQNRGECADEAEALAPVAPPVKPLDVAIVGMACIYPDAKDVDAFWLNVLAGKNQIREIAPERWSVETYYDPEASTSKAGVKTPSKWGGFIPETELNPGEFGIPPKALLSIEPAQILALKVARDALKDAGYLNRPFDRNKTAVFFGGSTGTDLSAAYGFRGYFPKIFGEMPAELDELLPRLTEDSFPGILANVIAGRVSNRLDLRGASCTIDAACASSLAALNLATKELITGTSDMVLCGGADLHTTINDYLLFSSVHALSPRDKCSPFDENADGTILGEGIACLVLKRLDDARRDNDRIYAIIKGLGASSDGKSLGITAPSKEGQIAALKNAYEQAGVSPAQIGLLEAHGTGTVAGDKAELAALSEVFLAAGSPRSICTLGSVKSQIGHTKAAAGMAGLIKAAKALYHGTLPPTAHIMKPNPYYQKEESPFVFRSIPGPWPLCERMAGVSSFGFGGANYHTILAADELGASLAQKSPAGWPVELFLFRGGSRAEALNGLDGLEQLIQAAPDSRLGDLALSVSTMNQKPVQCAALVRDKQDLLEKIGLIRAGSTGSKELFFAAESSDPTDAKSAAQTALHNGVVFLLPGQGSQRPGMAHELFVFFPRLQRTLAMTREGYGRELIDTLFPATAFGADEVARQTAALKDTRFAQTAIGAIELAMAELLRMTGVMPQMLAGHSYGELPALCLAGVFDQSDLVAITRARIDSILTALDPKDHGAMAAVLCSMERLTEVLGSSLDNASLAIANINAGDQIVITGTTNSVAMAVERLGKANVTAQKLPVACAFHSPSLGDAAETFRRKLAHFTVTAPHTPVWSNTTAAAHGQNPQEIIEQISRQIRCPVRFAEEIEAMYAAGGRIFVEVGPGSVLSGLTAKILKGRPHEVIPLEKGGESALFTLLAGLARLAVLGVPVDVMGLYMDRDVRQIELTRGEQARRGEEALWVIDGHAAWPKNGQEPQGCLRSLRRIKLVGKAGHAGADEQSVTDYLLNMRQLTKAQYEVMMRYLGASAGTLVDEIKIAAPSSSLKVAKEIPSTAMGATTLSKALVTQGAPQDALDIKALLLDVVSEKTGYPKDMLDLDLDMEADLSIDSIKRIEILGTLAERLGINLREGSHGDAVEETSKNKTLRAIIAFFEKQAKTLQPQAAAAVDQTKDQQGQLFGAIREAQKDLTVELTQLVQEIIAEKTGYPVDMLDPGLDLEADLSIDSIKRIEILGILKTRLELDIGKDAKNGAAVVSSKSIRDIVAWLRTHLEHGGDDAARAAAEESAATNAPHGSAGKIPLNRYVFGASELALVEGENSWVLKGQKIVITTDELAVAPALAAMLELAGALVDVVAAQQEEGPPDLSSYDMLIHLAPLGQTLATATAVQNFGWIKRALTDGVMRIMAATAQGGLFAHQAALGQDLLPAGGIMGMLHTVTHEYPEVCTRLVDVAPGTSPEEMARQIFAESGFATSGGEIGYLKGKRFVRRPFRENRLPDASHAPITLDREAVVVVTGGARGITAKCLMELARRFGCHFEIAGRTAQNSAPDEELCAARDMESVRKILIARGHKKPAEIEAMGQRALAEGEINRTIAALESAGASVTYHAIDIRDGAAFGALIDEILERRGRIDGFIHGAGILDDRFIKDKTDASFARVFATKVEGAKVIAQKAPPTTRFVLFFSSVAGCFGNAGQVDYAAANDAMDRIAWWLSRRIEGRALAINWGPWNGTGMVTPGLERAYQKRGIGLIDLDEGVGAMLDELLDGNRSQVQVVYMCAELESLSSFQGERKKPAA